MHSQFYLFARFKNSVDTIHQPLLVVLESQRDHFLIDLFLTNRLKIF